MMTVGIPREMKDDERRVALTPAMVKLLCQRGHRVLVESQAGAGVRFSDQDFIQQGAEISPTAAEVWQQQIVVKVKEPLPSEYHYFHPDLTLFCYLHLAAEPQLTQALCDSGATALAFETVTEGKILPLLRPMSEVAGCRAPIIAASLHEHYHNGRGILLGGIPGVESAKVVIIGGGSAGTSAARMAMGMGARVVLLEVAEDRLRELDVLFGGRVTLIKSNSYNISEQLLDADVLISAVLIAGAKAPQVVNEQMVEQMPESSVIIDIAIDQGGSVATIDRTTSHSDPVYIKHGVLHYAVPNIPGATPRTATLALTNALAPYVLDLADHLTAGQRPRWHQSALNVHRGQISHPAVAKAHPQLQSVCP